MNENEFTTESNIDNNNNTAAEISKIEKNKRGKAKFLIIGFLVVIAIAVGLYFGYKKLNNDPMVIYKDSINGIYKVLNNGIKDIKENSLEDFDIAKEPINVELNAKFESNMSELKNFVGLNYHFDVGMDLANKKMNVDLGIKDNNDSIINLILSVINKNIYLKSPEIYNKVLDLGEEDIFENMNFDSYLKVNGNNATFNYDNYSYILKELKTIIIDSLDKNKFKMENETITINEKEYKAKKAIYNLDKENIKRTLEFIKKRILKDEKLIKAIAESVGITEESLKESLNENINMNDYYDVIINLYTDKLNNLIAGSIIIDNEENIRFDYIKDEFNLEIKDDNNSLEFTKEANGNLIFTCKEGNDNLIKLIFEGNDKELKVPYMIDIEGNTISGTIEFKNIESGKNGISADYSFSLNATILEQKLDFSLVGNYKIAKTNVETLDTKGSIKVEDISEEEAMEIFTKLSEILERFNLSDIAGSLM